MPFNLTEATNTHMCRKKIYLPRPKSLFPSEASVQYEDQHGILRTEGTCHRQTWYRLSGLYEKASTTPYTERIFLLGKIIEQAYIEEWKQMGLWVDNNVKFYDKERNISGEVDCVMVEPETGKLFVVECKTFYGYNATKEICGNKSQAGKPKTSQMLQALIYVDVGMKQKLWDYVKLVYVARDSDACAEYDISLTEKNGIHYPTINGVIDWRFTMEDIYERYDQLTEKLKSTTPPPRDYSAEWDAEKVKSNVSTWRSSRNQV